MEELIARFGLLAIFVGAALEGEPFALEGGVFAHRGWMSLHAAVPTAAAGAIFIDQFSDGEWPCLCSAHFEEVPRQSYASGEDDR